MTAVICALLALAQLLVFAHVNLVAHRTCALHGEAVHAGVVAAPAGIESVLARFSPTADTTAGHEHEHEHCERFLLSSRPRDGAPSLVLSSGRAFPLLEMPAAPIELLSQAPKSSPPA
jgi:hypothetical protein